MQEPKWTKGPWTAHLNWASEDGVANPAFPDWCEVQGPKCLSISGNFGIANARLIAAAPDLFDALLSVREFVQDELDNRDCAGGSATDYVNDAKRALEIIDGAIAKAKGE